MIEDGRFEINLRYFFTQETSYSIQYPEYINQVVSYFKKKNLFLSIDNVKAEFLNDTDIDTVIDERTGIQRKYFNDEKITDIVRINNSLNNIKAEAISSYLSKKLPNRFAIQTHDNKMVIVPLFHDIQINKNDKEYYGYFFLFRCITLHSTLIYEFLDYHLKETFNGAMDEFATFISDSVLMFEEQIRLKPPIKVLIKSWIKKKTEKNNSTKNEASNNIAGVNGYNDTDRFYKKIKAFFDLLSKDHIISGNLVDTLTNFTIAKGRYEEINFENSENCKYSNDWNLYALINFLHSKQLIDFYKKEDDIYSYIIDHFKVKGKKLIRKGFVERCKRFEKKLTQPPRKKNTNRYRTYNSIIEATYFNIFS